jgi:hypothetical protein
MESLQLKARLLPPLLLLLWRRDGVESGREAKGGFTLQVQQLVIVQEGLCVHVPCDFSYPWKAGLTRTQFTATGTGKGPLEARTLWWPQMTHIYKCRRQPRADSICLGTPKSTAAPWTSEMPGRRTRGHTSFGWREEI